MKKSPICNDLNMKKSYFVKINKIIESCETVDHISQTDSCIDILESMFNVKLSNLEYLRTKLRKKLSFILK